MQAKRILIITNRIPYPLNDGGNLAMHAMIYGYKKEGWEVCLLAMNTLRHYIVPQKLKEIYQDIDYFKTADTDNFVRLIPTIKNFLFSSLPNHAERFYHRSFEQKIKDVISKFNPEVVQLESIYLSEYLPAIKKYTNAYTILRLHNLEHQVWQRVAGMAKNPFKKIYLKNLAKRIKKYEERVWKSYDLLLGITPEDSEAVKKYTPHVLTVPFGIEYQPPANNNEAKWNLYHIGAMDWLPNTEAITWFLKDVWPAIHRKYTNMEFFFAGRNMPAHLIAAEVDGARCMGEVPDANAFIADKKILVVPLQSGGGIRVKILEAMAEGKIVISTDVGMQGIHAQADVHYIRANNKHEFLEAVDKCMANREWADRLGKNAVDLIKSDYDNKLIMHDLMLALQAKMSTFSPVNQ